MNHSQTVRDEALLAHFKVQALACAQLDSLLTAGLVTHMAEDYKAGGPVHALLADWGSPPTADALALRLCGALHGAVLTGRDTPLAEAYAAFISGGIGIGEVWSHAEAFLTRDTNWVRDYLQYAPQTNEARRSILLLTGFLHLAEHFDQDMHILELGASAGLNMNWDQFRYEMDDWSWGPAGSPVTLSTPWTGPAPPVNAPLRIASRSGCDLNPLDLTDDAALMRLRSYCWSDVAGRMARLDGAIKVALANKTKPEKASAADWLESKLAARSKAGVTVVYHSIFLQYPPHEERARIYDLMEQAGAEATQDAPLAWLRFEPEILQTFQPDILAPTLDIVTWPGGKRRALARSNGHVTAVQAF